MARWVNKLISILIVLAFISTSTNLNYISSNYISNDKDALRSMSANKVVVKDLQQSFITSPAPAETDVFLGASSKASSAGQEIEKLKHDAVFNLRQMFAEKGFSTPEIERFIQRALKVLEKPEPVSLDEAPFTKSGNYKVGFEPTVPILPDITTKTTGLTAVVLTKEGLRGKALGLDKGIPAEKKQISQIKDQSDGRAKGVFEYVVEEENAILMVTVSEGFGRDGVEESFKANDVIVPNALLGETVGIRDATDKESSYTSTDGEVYEIADAIIDVIEGTKPLVTNVDGKTLSELGDDESGGTSIMVKGPGVRSLGNCPDVYADGIFTTVPAGMKELFVKNPLDPEETAKNPYVIEYYLLRIAMANNITIDDLEVVMMERKREEERLAVLREIQKKHNGLVITTITDGTVAQTLVATFGRKEGKHKVFMSVGGSPETFFNLAVAGGIYMDTAIASVRVYSKGINKISDAKGAEDAADLNRRYAFSAEEIANMESLRPDDAAEILTGQKLFTQEDVKGDVVGSVSFITNNGVYNVEGVTVSQDKGFYTETTLRFAQAENRPYVWFEKNDYADFWYDNSSSKVLPEPESISTILSSLNLELMTVTSGTQAQQEQNITKQLVELKNILLKYKHARQELNQPIVKSSSSGGTVFETSMNKLDNTIDSLLSTDQSEFTLEAMQAFKSRVKSLVKALKGLNSKDIIADDILARQDSLKRAEQILGVMQMPLDLAGLIAEDAAIKGVMTKVSQSKIGGIVIDDNAMDIGWEQKRVLLSLYGKASPVRAKLEEKLKVKIILHSQYAEADKMANMIAISNRELLGPLKSIMRIEIDMKNHSDNIILIGPNLVLAQQLLLYNVDRTNETMLGVSKIYQMIAKRPLPIATMQFFIRTGVFKLELPPAVPVDKNYYAEFERISAYTLVAA